LTVKKSTNPKMSPKEYNAILAQVELQDISLEECSAKIRKDRIAKSLKVSIKDRISFEEQSEDLLWINHNYELVACSDSKKNFALKISGLFRLGYSSKAPLSEAFLEIFLKHSVPMHTWPYFRELVQNMTQRMNIPPLTLPLLR
jgi:preprotein translocase subunit SecB